MNKTKELRRVVSTSNREAFMYYKKYAKKRRVKETYHVEKHMKIVNMLWKVVADNIVEKEAGVFLRTLGYFVNVLTPTKNIEAKRVISKEGVYTLELLNPHSKSRIYSTAFLPMNIGGIWLSWSMDKAACVALKSRVSEKIKSGFKYLNHYPILHDMYGKTKFKTAKFKIENTNDKRTINS